MTAGTDSENSSPGIDLDQIIEDLDSAGRRLQREAIHEAREHRDLVIPRLIEVLRDAAAAARAGDPPEGNAHFFALFLLTEFQAKEAFPAILEAVSLPGELPEDLFGDAVTSTLSRVFALFAGDQPELIDGLIGDRALNEYVRWSAAQMYVFLVRDGRLQREEAVERLRQHLREAINNNDEEVAGPLVDVLCSFAPKEAYDDIVEAYRREVVDPFLIDLQGIDSAISKGEAWVRRELDRCQPTGIEDTIAELETWAGFREETEESYSPPPAPHFPREPFPLEPVTSTLKSQRPRAGRNDPCPCGSGKKFKKCCGSRR